MATDIIDLTATRSGDIVVAVSDDTDPGEKSASKRPKRKAKKRKSTIHSREHSKPNDLNSVSVEASSTSTPSEFVADLFYVDIASGSKPQPIAPSTVLDASQPDLPRLLLPSHVSVFGEDLVEMEQPVQTDVVYGDDDYIQYLDLDDRKDFKRYFEDEQPAKPRRILCKACGAEGQHKTYECPVKICLTCGARDEHSTYSCPRSKTCFACGMLGHVRSDCPNPTDGKGRNGNCDRCDSAHHSANECPDLWRSYTYLSKSEQINVLETRRSKAHLALGDGGEGFISEDLFCHNCGGWGHLGDDCNDLPHRDDRPGEHSAFGMHNLVKGPFNHSTIASGALPNPKRRLRDWEEQNNRWDMHVPEGVGKRGKIKEMSKLKKQQRETQADEDNWFERQSQNRPLRQTPVHSLPAKPRISPISMQRQHVDRRDRDRPTLAARLSDMPRANQDRSAHPEYSRRDGEGGRSKQRGEKVHGPRYSGSYSRS